MYHGYHHDLSRLIESEVLGQWAFATAARSDRSPTRRAQWRTLERLEVQTHERAEAFLRRVGRPVPAARAARVAGGVFGVLPWRPQLRLLFDTTRVYLPVFERLERAHRGGPDHGLFAYIVEHERALATFAQRERAGQGGSLDDVERLLDGAPPTDDAGTERPKAAPTSSGRAPPS